MRILRRVVWRYLGRYMAMTTAERDVLIVSLAIIGILALYAVVACVLVMHGMPR